MEGGGDDDVCHTTGMADGSYSSHVEPGRDPPQVESNPNDTINFGWFSVPRQGQTAQTGQSSARSEAVQGDRERPRSRPASQGSQGPHDGRLSRQSGLGVNGSRPPSNRGRNVPRQTGVIANHEMHQGAYCDSTDDSQCLVVNNDKNPNEVDAECQGQQWNQTSQASEQIDSRGQAAQREIDAVDWPLSRAAQEMMMRAVHPPAEPGFYKSCVVPGAVFQENTPAVPPTPPTPMPPLSWDGYRNSARPTFATWREQWHGINSRSQSLHGRNLGPHDHDIFNSDLNNSSCGTDFNNNNSNSCESNDEDNNIKRDGDDKTNQYNVICDEIGDSNIVEKGLDFFIDACSDYTIAPGSICNIGDIF